MSHATARRIIRDARERRTGSRSIDHIKALGLQPGDLHGSFVGARVFGGFIYRAGYLAAIFRHPTKVRRKSRMCWAGAKVTA